MTGVLSPRGKEREGRGMEASLRGEEEGGSFRGMVRECLFVKYYDGGTIKMCKGEGRE